MRDVKDRYATPTLTLTLTLALTQERWKCVWSYWQLCLLSLHAPQTDDLVSLRSKLMLKP